MTTTTAQAKRAIDALKKLKMLLAQGRISRDHVEEFAKPFINTWDSYNKAESKKAGVPFRKFSLSGFLR